MIKWILFAGLVASSVHAQAGDAGCGLGSLIFRDNSKLLQLFAMTTNNMTLSQPLGITSGTSNCSARGIVMREKAVQYYVEINHDDLTREMAQGHGEKLTTLAALYGCQGADQQKFAEMTQMQFGSIVPEQDTTAGDIATNLNREFQARLSTQCTSI